MQVNMGIETDGIHPDCDERHHRVWLNIRINASVGNDLLGGGDRSWLACFFVMMLQDVKGIDNIALMPSQTKEKPRCELPVVLCELRESQTCQIVRVWLSVEPARHDGTAQGRKSRDTKKADAKNPVNNRECLASALADLPLSYPARTRTLND